MKGCEEMTDNGRMHSWELSFCVVFGRGDASDDVEFDVPCTDEEYEILKKIENGDEAYEGYSSYEDIEELHDFVCLAEEMAYEQAMIDMAEIDDEEVENLESGGYYVTVWFDI